jgi:hypothetical protein
MFPVALSVLNAMSIGSKPLCRKRRHDLKFLPIIKENSLDERDRQKP